MSEYSDFIIKDGIVEKYVGTSENVIVPDGVTGIGKNAFYCCSRVFSVSVPGSVKIIAKEAFAGCENLANIELSEGLEQINEQAFNNCKKLCEIISPNTLSRIGRGAFAYCSNLKSVQLSDQLTRIEDMTFINCKKLTTVKIPKSVKTIGRAAFAGTGLKTITVDEKNVKFMELDGNLYDIDGRVLIAYANSNKRKNFIIPDGVEEIASCAFWECAKLESVILPDSIRVIRDRAFVRCKNLKGVIIPKDLRCIEEYAFAECKNLDNLTISNAETVIVPEAFRGCSNLINLSIFENASVFDWQVVNECKLTHLYVSPINIVPTKYKWAALQTFLNTYEQISPTYKFDESYETYIKKQHKKIIKDHNCEISLYKWLIDHKTIAVDMVDQYIADTSSIDIKTMLLAYKERSMTPDIVNKLEKREERRMQSASPSSITATEAKKTWKFEKNADDDQTMNILFYKGLDAHVEIPSTIGRYRVTKISNRAFGLCSKITSITVPESITNIGEAVFSGCSNLQNINVSEGNDHYKSINGILFDKNEKTLISYPSGIKAQNYVVPCGVVNIEDHAFEGCSGLNCLVLPNSVINIGDYAFNKCSNLTKINIPNSVMRIGKEAFSRCTSLRSISIPESVTRIESFTFGACMSLTDVLFSGSISNIEDRAFKWCSSLKTFIVPSGVKEMGVYAFEACEALETVIISEGVEKIGEYAFTECEKLKKVFIPNSVTSIGRYAFYIGAKNLVIHTPAGSYAEKYAKRNGIKFVAEKQGE